MKNQIFKIVKRRKRDTWTDSDDEALLYHVQNNQKRKNWKKIGKILSKTPYDCFIRFKSLNPYIKRGDWTNAEDSKLIHFYLAYGKNWAKIAKHFPNRNSQQIRNRYINYLDPNISKSKFTFEEDRYILYLHSIYGNKWSKIQKHIPNRSQDMIKNRFNSSVRNNRTLLYKVK